MDLSPIQIIGLILVALLVIFLIVALKKAIRIVPQQAALIVERLGRYSTTFDAGLHFLVPFIDRVRAGVDLREQVVSFPPQAVITSDNIGVQIDTVIYFTVTNPKDATYEIANYITAIEQLTATTLRNVIGSMDMEQTLTSRDQINGQLRGVLDEATGRWGIRVSRVELKTIEPPATVRAKMELQMSADREKRAAVLTAEGVKQSQILSAEGEKQSAILRAEGQAQSAILRSQGEAKAILQVFDAIHTGDADPKLLAYQYLQVLPQIANGNSSKMWVVPTEFTAALSSIAGAFGGAAPTPAFVPDPDREAKAEERRKALTSVIPDAALQDPAEALREARGSADEASAEAQQAGTRSGRPFSREAEAGQAPDDAAPQTRREAQQQPQAPAPQQPAQPPVQPQPQQYPPQQQFPTQQFPPQAPGQQFPPNYGQPPQQ